MVRARFVAYAALMLVLASVATASAAPGVVPVPAATAPLAAVGWPPSSGLLVAEVVTGGASASDEYVELTNAAPVPMDLVGLEAVYVTSSGATVTRKAAWTTTLILEPGRHLLLANSLGTYAPIADATYSGGLAATGGAIVLRAIGGSPVDAVGWGDAVNAFVEGSAAAAPPAGSSLERAPGGSGGNTIDTNANGADFVLNGSPVPQDLASDPVPAPGASPSAAPSESPSPTASASPTPTPEPTPSPTPSPSPSPTPMPTPSPTPGPTVTPSSSPSPTATPAPSPSPTPSPSPSPTPTPSPATDIALARALPDGSTVTVEGTLTTALGALESGRTGFVQDATGGIALYLDAALDPPIPAGSVVRVSGVVDSRYAQRTLRVAGAGVQVIGAAALPAALPVVTGAAGEPLEGLRLELGGTVVEAPSALADGLGLLVDDGSGPVRVIAGIDALGGLTPVTGSTIRARGPLGQRDSGGTGLGGYRLHATQPGELEVVSPSPSPTPSPTVTPPPTPAPTPAPTPSPTPTPAPTTTPTPTPTPTPAPTSTPTPVAVNVAAARAVPVGVATAVRGVVIAEAGRLGTPPLLVIADDTGGIPVRLPDGVPGPARGTLVEVHGTIADPYGQTELRTAAGGLIIAGTGPLPVTLAMDAGDAGEETEGRLATVHGTITVSASKATSGDLAFTIEGEDGASLRVLTDRSAGLDATSLRKGLAATFTGIVGQRASRKGALDGYRLWLRDRADVVATAAPAATPTPSPSPSASVPAIAIATARLREGARVGVEGVLTIDRTLLDSNGRRTVVEDATGAIEVYLAAPDSALRAGVRVRVSGVVGRAYGAPRIRADQVSVLGSATPVVRDLRSAPSPADEWRLVRVSGTITDLHRLGERWLAELDLGGRVRVPVIGLAGSGIPASLLTEGRRATVTGIVRGPYPTATDRRLAIVPRSPADLVLGLPPATGSGPGTPSARQDGGSASGEGTARATAAAAPAVDLAHLADHLGRPVRVGGLVTTLEADGARIDDGTATVRLVLKGDAADLLALLQPGDALNATGIPETRDEIVLVVADPAALVLAGDLGATAAADGRANAPAGALLASPSGHTGPRSPVGQAMDLAPASMGFGTLALVATMSVLITVVRRYRGRRVLQARIITRLEALARPGPGASRGGPEAPG